MIRPVPAFADFRRFAAADYRPQLARLLIYHNGGGLRYFIFARCAAHARVILPCGKRVLHNVLHFGIHRKINRVSAATQFAFYRGAVCGRIEQPAFLQQIILNIPYGVFNKVEHIIHLIALPLFNNIHIVVQRGLHLVVCYEARLIHALYYRIRARIGNIHLVLPGLIARSIRPRICVAPGVVTIGCFYHAGKHCAFAYAQLGKLFAEIILRRSLHAVIGLAKVYVVQVRFKDFILVHCILHLECKVRFLYLPSVADFACEELIFDQLLGKRASARIARCTERPHYSRKQPLIVHAAVPVKPYVLNGYNGIFKHIGHGFYIHPVAVFIARERGDQFAVHVIYIRCSVALCKQGHVKFRRCVYISLGNAKHQSKPRAAQKQHAYQHEFARCEKHAQHKRSAPLALNEQFFNLSLPAARARRMHECACYAGTDIAEYLF